MTDEQMKHSPEDEDMTTPEEIISRLQKEMDRLLKENKRLGDESIQTVSYLRKVENDLIAAHKQRDHWQNAARSLERDYTALVAKYRTMQWVIRTQARLPDEENLAPRALGVMASVEVKDE